MADSKISALPSKNTPEDSDLLPVVDSDDTTTKKTTILGLYNYMDDKLAGPEFTRDGDGNITRIDYNDGSYKEFTYTTGKLTRIDTVLTGFGSIKRKTFIYSGDTLSRIDDTII